MISMTHATNALSPPRNHLRQSTLSIALEALAGGFVVALIIVSVKRLLGL